MYTVARPINGISVNGFEYLYNEQQQLMTFNSKDEAIDFLSRQFPTMSRVDIEEAFYFQLEEEVTT